jgi:uncharacterized protein (TIGR00730 family)
MIKKAKNSTHHTRSAFSLCVYCGSRPGTDPAFAQMAHNVGHWIGCHQGQLVYGGGKNGLMGALANATLSAGGTVVGVIPQALMEREHGNTDCTELIVVPNMHERKRVMAERANAFVALVGGIGTFEELFEIWSWRQLGYHNKPLGLLNTDGYFNGLISFFDHCVQSGLMDQAQMEIIKIGNDWQSLLPDLVEAAGFSTKTQIHAI